MHVTAHIVHTATHAGFIRGFVDSTEPLILKKNVLFFLCEMIQFELLHSQFSPKLIPNEISCCHFYQRFFLCAEMLPFRNVLYSLPPNTSRNDCSYFQTAHSHTFISDLFVFPSVRCRYWLRLISARNTSGSICPGAWRAAVRAWK